MSAFLQELLQDDFNILNDKCGHSLIENTGVKIDHLLYPKSHLIENGFDPGWVGIEVKHFSEEDGSGKAAETFWQAISYNQQASKSKHKKFVLFWCSFSPISMM